MPSVLAEKEEKACGMRMKDTDCGTTKRKGSKAAPFFCWNCTKVRGCHWRESSSVSSSSSGGGGRAMERQKDIALELELELATSSSEWMNRKSPQETDYGLLTLLITDLQLGARK
ncbi:uncharacterized protein BDCG_03985 [Blastomyces dermatitidis ER-3]|uniref:Uncharacterized protein n=2 Tax=Ajellomyces dermatitidis TaxID=5039 RepID=F2TEU1_AJEDA|nr:uncharacterized protein BDCG_03985 [Blastomyces dermatitidis ER-3]EEQ88864.1 hypothetical protein BDCG_03985 [Blastomyces dermatitidis ER-3]EGE81726.1 hypothetical protein BDDG_04669 [Blastomyces dermatitidis ATCC 18188]EQL31394.1 hypothetical protein BDFG_06219 [Blastomyces dermatitidis ATCC 26199]